MADLNSINKRVRTLFTSDVPKVFEKHQKIGARTTRLKSNVISRKKERFSPFVSSHMFEAREVYLDFMKVADSVKDDVKGIEKVMDRFDKLNGEHHPELLYYAMMIFMTHHPKGQKLTIPGIEERIPNLVLPSGRGLAKAKSLRTSKAKNVDESLLAWYREDPLLAEHHEHWHVVFPFGGLPDKDGTNRLKDRHGELFFYMHRQMLARYDTERILGGFEKVIPYDNYQIPILEGYDPGPLTSDGFMSGYDKRKPNTPYRDTGIGYSVETQTNQQKRFLEAGKKGQFRHYTCDRNLIGQLKGITPKEVEEIYAFFIHEDVDIVMPPGDLKTNQFNPDNKKATIPLPKKYAKYGKELSDLIRAGYREWEVTSDLFGDSMEANIDSVDTGTNNRSNALYYGNFHGSGHVMGALINSDNMDKPGVMWNPATAQRDPYFYRWHKGIDDQWYNWDKTLAPADLSDYPNVQMRKGIDQNGNPWTPDIILVQEGGIPGMDKAKFDGQKQGEMLFGNASGANNFDRDFSNGTFETMLSGKPAKVQTTDTLNTYMGKRTIHYQEVVESTINSKEPLYRGNKMDIDYLYHPDYSYFVRVRNNEPFAKKVTVRIFLCLMRDGNAEERRMWIEMDKFVHELDPMEKAVIHRPADLSSVVRKPSIKDPAKTDIRYNKPDPEDPANQGVYYCECGWPYSLLLPRGTREGEEFKLMVMVTDFDLDHVDQETCCGSMSYCGAKERYPDARPMGYPFHTERKKGQTISDMIASQPNMASRTIKIQEVDAPKK